jgi:hypothetical protein
MSSQMKCLMSAVAGAVMALSAGAANALTVSGTFDSIYPYTGGASVTFELLSSGGITTVISGTGPTFGGLYSPAPVAPSAVLSLPSFQSIYSFTSLAAGIYTFELFGPAGTGFTFDIIPSYGTSVALVPEPESLALGIAGLGVLGMLGRRRLSATSSQA